MLSFAIAIPNLNQSDFLPTALESLRHQSTPYHLAVMDGGSTDDFVGAAAPYSDIINFQRSGPDEGQADAIKEGLERVYGDIVTWLNADDFYFPSALGRVAAFFEQNPEVDVVYGDAIHVDEKGFFLSYFPPIQKFNKKDLTRTCFICQPACFMRHSAYERIGGIDATLHYTMDWDLWCRLSKAGARFYYLHEVLAAVRYYPGTKTMSGGLKRYLEIWRIERKYGRRLLPLSWPGFYFYDLTMKTIKSPIDRLALSSRHLLRSLGINILWSRYSQEEPRRTLYGFYPWTQTVEKRCTIHLPWYDERDWEKLRVKLQPQGNYVFNLNGVSFESVTNADGWTVVDVPSPEGVIRRIKIENLDQKTWRLLDFSLELETPEL